MMNSSFVSIIETDFIPDDADVIAIKQFILQQTSHLSSLLSKIAEAKSQYDDLCEQQVNLERSIEVHRRLILPSRRNIVPEDIWREIFYHCLPAQHDAIMHPREAPSLLTQVCSSWRQITYSTPRLWSSAHIPVVELEDTTHPRNNERALAQRQARSERRARSITDWLNRSSSCPLSITVGDSSFFPFADTSYEATQGHILFKAILPFSKQWGRLNIAMTKARLADFSGLKASDFPSLVSLQLESITTWELSNAHTPLSLRDLPLFLAANLHQIKISPATEDISTYPLRWHHLTELVLHHYPQSMIKIINLLRKCPMMIHFRVAGALDPLEEPLTQLQGARPQNDCEPVCFTNLKTVEISIPVNDYHSDAFDNLVMPALETVSSFIPSLNRSPLLSLAQHCDIISLNTSSTLFSEEDFILCLRYCNHLISLYLNNPPSFNLVPAAVSSMTPLQGTDTFLKLLSVPDDNDEILCPCLEEFHCATRENQFSDQGILRFIEVKQARNHPKLVKLKRLKIYLPRHQNDPMAEILQPYLEDGLDLGLQYKNKLRGRRVADEYRNISYNIPKMFHHAEVSTRTKLF
ncbi:hypothetical protein CPB83DRAFT_859382 [Crepidotus variabilis]|uniref:F-box domain-containing protein n=1 Tax=Crepidotus variabilis TaxID=179855 RepID=A0A9P6EAJ8_9AGAR|nr:hypothetical protein CPB83DRAFT_859382 [Crepidotus variabilis]